MNATESSTPKRGSTAAQYETATFSSAVVNQRESSDFNRTAEQIW
jgi:hypothetical protein